MMRARSIGLVAGLTALALLLGATSRPLTAQDADPHKRLKELLSVKKIDLDFEDADLKDVLSYIQSRSGASIVIDQAIWDEVDEDDTRVTLALKNVSVANGLGIVMDFTGLKYVFRFGVVWITTPARAYIDATVLRIYDVRDLTMKIRNFPGTRIRLRGNEGGTGPALQFEDEEELVEPVDVDALESLIPEVVAPDTWSDIPQATILQLAGLLIIRQTRDVHREIARFLNLLRANK